ncbi:hypothetical protein FGO68_gene13657 [Halteria grandinella]|uniref:Splicing factor cactin central domain-containing protein n=1 Tax=Halteria grandinella TaxID=5974 RepID=A0A8J8NWG6_HALGN|nr:hypothetical protein FGO68_gene13657 [Halteria grandinella]
MDQQRDKVQRGHHQQDGTKSEHNKDRNKDRKRRGERSPRKSRSRDAKSSSNSSRSSSLYSSKSASKEKDSVKGEWNERRDQFQRRGEFINQSQVETRHADQLKPTVPEEETFDQWKVKEDAFHLEQAILRSKIRIEKNREKPIDFLAKVILIIAGKLSVTTDFLSTDFKTPYSIFNLVATSAELKEISNEIQVFMNVGKDPKMPGFYEYWESMKVLCERMLERKLRQEQSTKVTKEEAHLLLLKQTEEEIELEKQAEELILDKGIEELAELKGEIESSLASDRSFAEQMSYWSSVLKKIEEQTAKTRVEQIYQEYCQKNKEQIDIAIQTASEAKKKALHKRTDLSGAPGSKKYETPFTALKIDNIKKLPVNTEADAILNIPESIEHDKDDNDFMYNDGALSPFVIPYEEAGYLQALAVTDAQITQEQELVMRDFLMKQLKKFMQKNEESKMGQDSMAVDQENLTSVEKVKKTALNTLHV